MRQLITLLGACLLLGSIAVAADGPANQADQRQWSNSSLGSSAISAPRVNDYGPAKPAISAPTGLEPAPASRAAQPAEFAPDPPAVRHSEAIPVVYEQDPAPLAETLAEKARTFDAANVAAAKPVPPPRRLTDSAKEARSAPATPALVETPSAPAAVQPALATPLGLGSHSDKNSPGKNSPLSAMITVGGSLAIVLGLFFLVAWAMRKTAPRGSLALPREVFEILGRAPLGARQHVQLLRCGNKLLLVSIMPGGTETLTEIIDPLEVDRIAGICRQAHPQSSSAAFRQVFQRLAPSTGEPAALDLGEPAGARKKRYRWEEKHA